MRAAAHLEDGSPHAPTGDAPSGNVMKKKVEKKVEKIESRKFEVEKTNKKASDRMSVIFFPISRKHAD